VGIALLSTVVVFGTIVLVVVNSPGWPKVKASFFNVSEFRSTFPDIARHFVLDVKVFCILEVAILILALGIAVVRSLPGPIFFPLRALAIVYTDFFRGIPTILVIFLLGFGVPGLQLSAVPSSALFWGGVGLVLVYTAYVSEVYRAGIESVHWSQTAAARSLGLSHGQTMRHVVVPQAVRRVIPPLLNDFIGLQKDTSLINALGVLDVVSRARFVNNSRGTLAAYSMAALLFLLVTIPFTRWLDGLIRRQQAKTLAGR
jgi:polar amino acid transport system permease protein